MVQEDSQRERTNTILSCQAQCHYCMLGHFVQRSKVKCHFRIVGFIPTRYANSNSNNTMRCGDDVAAAALSAEYVTHFHLGAERRIWYAYYTLYNTIQYKANMCAVTTHCRAPHFRRARKPLALNRCVVAMICAHFQPPERDPPTSPRACAPALCRPRPRASPSSSAHSQLLLLYSAWRTPHETINCPVSGFCLPLGLLMVGGREGFGRLSPAPPFVPRNK